MSSVYGLFDPDYGYLKLADMPFEVAKDLHSGMYLNRAKAINRSLAFLKKNSVTRSVWVTALMALLQAGQVITMYKVYDHQKELAKKTFDLADKQQQLAQDIYGNYLANYRPHEVKFGDQINDYFAAATVRYGEMGGRFASNAVQAYVNAKDGFRRSMGEVCGVSSNLEKQFEIDRALRTTEAKTRGYRFAEGLKDYRDTKWLEYRNKYINVGAPIRQQGQTALHNAFLTVSGFGADPGAAMQQLLGSVANMLGQFSVSGLNQGLNWVRGSRAVPSDALYTVRTG